MISSNSVVEIQPHLENAADQEMCNTYTIYISISGDINQSCEPKIITQVLAWKCTNQ